MKPAHAGMAIAILFFLSAPARAQVVQPHRFEIEQKSGKPPFAIIPLGVQGLGLIRDKDEFRAGKKNFELIVVDTALQKRWDSTLEIPFAMELVGYDFVAPHLHLLFREGEVPQGNFLLLRIHAADQSAERFEIKQEFHFKLTHFSATPRNIVLGGLLSNEPSVLIYRLADRQLKVVPGFFLSGMELLDVRVNENFTFNALISARVGSNNDRKLILRTFDEDGVLLLEDDTELPSGLIPLSGMTSNLTRPDLAVVGTYARGKNRLASGIYFTAPQPDWPQPVQFIEFDRLPHFLDYLPPRKADKIRRQALRARLKGGGSSFRANVIPFRMAENPTGFALLLEIYNASSAMNASPHLSPFGMHRPPGWGPGWTPFASRFYSMPYSFYDPLPQAMDYRMLASQVVVLDENGHICHDVQLPLKRHSVPVLEQTSDFVFTQRQTSIIYKHESNLYSLLYAHHTGVARTDTVEVVLNKETETIKNESDNQGGVRWWFGNSFYAWGTQTVRDSDKQSDYRSRYLFYVNRVDASP
jgi:hypothetical protein